MDKKSHLKSVLKSCQDRFGRGSSDTWKHSDFSDFSFAIQKETKINISVNTLKRIFGKISVDDNYLPQQATLDALKKYSGYNFLEETDHPTIVPTQSHQIKSNVLNRSAILWGLLIIGLIFFTSYLFFKIEKPNLGAIKIADTEGLLPKTALFDIQLPDSKDSLFMDFGDKSHPIYLDKGVTKISHTYLFPGVFKVDIKNSKDYLVRTNIYVPSNKWLGLGFFRQREIPNSYYAFPAAKTGLDSVFHISSEQLQRAGLDTIRTYYTRLCNFTPIDNYSDNFVFETRFKKASPQKGIYCNSMRFQIAGLENMIRFNFVSSGCSSQVLNVISEKYIKGTDMNLSQFVLDLEKWNTAKVVNQNKNISLYINEKLIYKTIYKQTLGDLRGLFVEFEGNGYVKNCSLKSLEGKILYNF